MTASIDYGFAFDGVVVLESLMDGDEPTGEALYSHTVAPLATAASIRHDFIRLSTATELIAALHRIAAISQTHGQSPIVHFEMHGKPEGLVASDGSIATWDDVAAPLRQLNQASRFNLAVTLGACWGEYLVKSMRPIDRAPVCLLIGTAAPVWSSVVAAGFRRHYEVLLTTLDGAAAWRGLNEIGRPDGQFFGVWPARLLFERVFAAYFKTHLQPSDVRKRVDAIFSELVAQRRALITQGAQVRANIEKALTDRDYWIGKYRRHFFMLDLYPDNELRFPVSPDGTARTS